MLNKEKTGNNINLIVNEIKCYLSHFSAVEALLYLKKILRETKESFLIH